MTQLVQTALLAGLLLLPGRALAQFTWENPQADALVSGIVLISGWVCADGAGITIQIDDLEPLEAASGTSREDTVVACGDADNGFGLVFNWNILSDGAHIVRLLVNGEVVAEVSVVVVTPGAEFVSGASGSCTIPDLFGEGVSAVATWRESLQNATITDVILTATTGRLDTTPDVFTVLENTSIRFGDGLFGAGPSSLMFSDFSTDEAGVMRGRFAMVSDSGIMAAGNVDGIDTDGDGLADCNYRFDMSDFPVGAGPQVGQEILCAVCDFRLNTAGILPGEEGSGRIVLDLALARTDETVANPPITSDPILVIFALDVMGNVISVNGLPVLE